jgi:hypothetical protein
MRLIVVDEIAEFHIENSIDLNKLVCYQKRFVFNNIFCSSNYIEQRDREYDV